jgi:GPH family glycoside/pentoside/hexuronide:cation symporter
MPSIEESLPAPLPSALNERSAAIARQRKLSVTVKSIYGAGSVVDGIANTGLTYIAFFYLTAICGMSGTLAGMTTFVALLIDSCADPLIGLLSDNTQSRIGRRHPYLFASLLPLSISFALLFSLPASLGGLGLFCYVTALMLVLRISISLYDLPYLAIGAEISDDYLERSSIVGFRMIFSSIAAFACLGIALGGFGAQSRALLERAHYAPFGWICGGLILAAGLVVSIGTLRQIPRLHRAHPRTGPALAQLAREVREVFHNGSFVALFVTALIFFVAQGVAATLAIDANSYFWNLPASINQEVLLVLVLSPLLGLPIARALSTRIEKRTLGIGGLLLFCVCQFYPPVLRIWGVLPTDLNDLRTLLIANAAVIGIGLVFSGIGFQSMMADAADQHEYLFGARREATFLSGLTLSVKSATGLGSLIGGMALDAIHFPRDIASRGLHPHLPLAVVNGLGWVAGPLPAAFTVFSALALFGYKLNHEKYQAIQRALAERRR